MGNCSPKGTTPAQKTPNDTTIRVMTDSGTVLYFPGPKLVQEVVESFPGYGVFGQCRGGQSRGHCPLPGDESLVASQFYHLLPLETGRSDSGGVSNPIHGLADSLVGGPGLEVLAMPRRGDGVWKVKLVIGTKQLEEIMSREVNMEALIERMREAASSSSGNNGTTQSPKPGKVKAGLGVKPSLSSIFRTNSC